MGKVFPALIHVLIIRNFGDRFIVFLYRSNRKKLVISLLDS